MPGQQRHSLKHMMEEVKEAMGYGVKTFVLFPKVHATSSLTRIYGPSIHRTSPQSYWHSLCHAWLPT